MLWMPALSDLIRMVGVPVTTRRISRLSEGMMLPCASMIIGTRRMMPSRSVLIVNRPRPAAAFSSDRNVAQQAGEFEQEVFGGLLAERRDSGQRKRLVEFRPRRRAARFRRAPRASA